MKSTLNITATELQSILKDHAGKAFRGSDVKVESIAADESTDEQGAVTFNGIQVTVDVTPIEKERKERKKLTVQEKLERLQAKLAKAQADMGNVTPVAAHAKGKGGKPA